MVVKITETIPIFNYNRHTKKNNDYFLYGLMCVVIY